MSVARCLPRFLFAVPRPRVPLGSPKNLSDSYPLLPRHVLRFQHFPHSCALLTPSLPFFSSLYKLFGEKTWGYGEALHSLVRALQYLFLSLCPLFAIDFLCFQHFLVSFAKNRGVWAGATRTTQIWVTTLLSSVAARSCAAVPRHDGCLTSGASSTSGTRTNRRRCIRGCGTCNSEASMVCCP